MRLEIVSAYARQFGAIRSCRLASSGNHYYVMRMKVVYHEKHLALVRAVRSTDLRRNSNIDYLQAMHDLEHVMTKEGRIFLPLGEGPLDEDAARLVLEHVKVVDGKLVPAKNDISLLNPILGRWLNRGV
jgi:hypothetical protein